MLSVTPTVDYVDYSDGLLSVYSKKNLKPDTTAVKLRTSFGTIAAYVKVLSVDKELLVYRLEVLNSQLVLDQLEIDRREDVRLPKTLRLSSNDFPGYSGMTEDISVTGCRVATTGALEVGLPLDVKLELDDPEIPSMVLAAEVNWCAPKFEGGFHSGLEFQNVGREEGRHIKRYIEEKIRLEKKLHTLETLDDE